MNGDDIRERLITISEQFLKLRLASLEQQAQVNTLASVIFAVLPSLQPAFDIHLKSEQLKYADEAKEIDLQLRALRQGRLLPPSSLPN